MQSCRSSRNRRGLHFIIGRNVTVGFWRAWLCNWLLWTTCRALGMDHLQLAHLSACPPLPKILSSPSDVGRSDASCLLFALQYTICRLSYPSSNTYAYKLAGRFCGLLLVSPCSLQKQLHSTSCWAGLDWAGLGWVGLLYLQSLPEGYVQGYLHDICHNSK